MNIILKGILTAAGKEFSKWITAKVTSSKMVRDTKELLLTDNFHKQTIQLFEAAVVDAAKSYNISDEVLDCLR